MALLRYYETDRSLINEIDRAAGNVINCVDTGEIIYDVTDSVRIITEHIKIYQTLDDLKAYRDSNNNKINANLVYIVAKSKRFYIFNDLTGEFDNILTQDDADNYINSWVGATPAVVTKNEKRYAPMTIANNVYMQDGDSVEHKINQLGLMTSTFENIQVIDKAKTFDVPVPFEGFFNYPHCMIITIGTTVITPNRYSVENNKITFDEDIDIGRTINFFFMYNSKPGGNALAIENIDGANIDTGSIPYTKLAKVSSSYLVNDPTSLATSAGLKAMYDLIAALCNEKNITVRCTASKTSDTEFKLTVPQGFTDLIDGDIMSIKFDSDVTAGANITYNGNSYPIYTTSTTAIKKNEIAANDELYFQYNSSDGRFYVTNGMAYRMDQFTYNKVLENDGDVFSYEESGFLPGYDTLTVYLNGLKLIKDVNYSIDYKGKTISLIGFTAKTGDTVEFVIDRINRTRATRNAESIDFLDTEALESAATEVQDTLQKEIDAMSKDISASIKTLQEADTNLKNDIINTLKDYSTKTDTANAINAHHEIKNIPPKIGYKDDIKAKLSFSGLSCTIASTPILIGGYTSTFPQTTVSLTASATNYIYLNRNSDGSVGALVKTTPIGNVPSDTTLSDTSVFDSVLIAKVVTSASKMISNTIYPVGNSYLDKVYTVPLDSYPVGSIYMSVISTSPATLFGGKWEQMPAGRVLIGQGSSDYGVNFTNGNKGGEYTHTIRKDELPSFSFSGTTNWVDLQGKFSAARKEPENGGGAYPTPSGIVHLDSKSGTGWRTGTWHDNEMGNFSINASHQHTFSISFNGSNKAQNNMQPYMVVYMWKRTA